MPPPSTDSSGQWTGAYLGGNVGGRFADRSGSGVFGGGQIGYQMPLSTLTFPGSSTTPVLIGLEGDIQASGGEIDWLSTVRARLGVPVDDVFIYATGGLMVGGVNASRNLGFGGGAGTTVRASGTNVGPVVGGGLEFALTGSLTAKIEGLYYDLGDVKTPGPAVGGAPGNFDFKFRGGMIRVGINVKLGGLGGS